MTHERFESVFNELINKCNAILNVKSAEYSTEADKLHNFYTAAALTGEHPVKALGGMMLKHTVSVYDMMRDTDNGKRFDLAKWEEKIIDSINYLILLRAILDETAVNTMAIAALREKAERSKGCVWCKSDSKVTHNGEHFCFFCSYCGKRLEVEHGE